MAPPGWKWPAWLGSRWPTRLGARWPAWLGTRWPLALLMLCAEAGHLAAAAVEWPASTPRGALHCIAAAVLGFVAVGACFGPHRLELGLGFALCALVPVSWLAGTLGGPSPFRAFAGLAAGALSTVEVTIAVLIALRYRVRIGTWLRAAP